MNQQIDFDLDALERRRAETIATWERTAGSARGDDLARLNMPVTVAEFDALIQRLQEADAAIVTLNRSLDEYAAKYAVLNALNHDLGLPPNASEDDLRDKVQWLTFEHRQLQARIAQLEQVWEAASAILRSARGDASWLHTVEFDNLRAALAAVEEKK